MNNLFFKSPETYEKLINKLDMLLAEQRHQRADLDTIKRQLHRLISDTGLQKQVDEYFDEAKRATAGQEPDIPEVE